MAKKTKRLKLNFPEMQEHQGLRHLSTRINSYRYFCSFLLLSKNHAHFIDQSQCSRDQFKKSILLEIDIKVKNI